MDWDFDVCYRRGGHIRMLWAEFSREGGWLEREGAEVPWLMSSDLNLHA